MLGFNSLCNFTIYIIIIMLSFNYTIYIPSINICKKNPYVCNIKYITLWTWYCRVCLSQSMKWRGVESHESSCIQLQWQQWDGPYHRQLFNRLIFAKNQQKSLGRGTSEHRQFSSSHALVWEQEVSKRSY